MAAVERADCPATYNRIIQFSSLRGLSFLRARGLEEGSFRTDFFGTSILFINNSPHEARLLLFPLWSLRWTAVELR